MTTMDAPTGAATAYRSDRSTCGISVRRMSRVMPPPMPANMPRRAAITGLNPNVIAFCAPATAKNDNPAASNISTGVRSLSTPAYEKKVMSPARTEASKYRPSDRTAGGTAPINTSRVIPPKFPATKDRTRMPKMSSRRLTAATAPLIAKTKVPPKSRICTKVSRGIMTAPPAKANVSSRKHEVALGQIRYVSRHGVACFHTTYSNGSLRPKKTSGCVKPGQRADDQRLDASLHGGVQDRRELWAVIDRQLIQLARGLGRGINLGIIAAYEPKHRRHVPCSAEAAEILARRRRPRVLHPIGGKIGAKRLGDTVARSLVIHIQRVAVERGVISGLRGAPEASAS